MHDTTVPIDIRPQKFVVNGKGKRVGVIYDMKTYRKIQRILEDREDNRLIDESLGDETVPWEQVKEELDREAKPQKN